MTIIRLYHTVETLAHTSFLLLLLCLPFFNPLEVFFPKNLFIGRLEWNVSRVRFGNKICKQNYCVTCEKKENENIATFYWSTFSLLPFQLPSGLLFVDTLCEKSSAWRWVIIFYNGTISFNNVEKTTLLSCFHCPIKVIVPG